MGAVAVIGEPALVNGYALAGGIVLPAVDATSVHNAWNGLAEDVTLVVLTPQAAAVIGDTTAKLTAVMPQ